MFEECRDMAELTQARVRAVQSGQPAVLVNKAFAQRKAILLGTQDRGFKRIGFFPVPIPEVEVVDGVDFAAYDDTEPCVIYVDTASM